jgi:hypothetical protein
MEDEIDFFRENVIKSVPQLLIFTEGEDQVIIIKGSDEILNAIKEQ